LKSVDKFRVVAPCRADLAGGTLDLWPLFCLVPSSLTLNIALDLFARVDFEVSENFQFEVVLKNKNDQYQMSEVDPSLNLDSVPDSLKFPVFIVNQFLILQRQIPRVSMQIDLGSAVPVGSGLGGSSTLLVSLGRGLCRVCSDFTEQGWQWRFLQWAKDTEAAFLKVPTGTQDYLAAIFGGLHGYEYQLGRIEQTSFPPSVFQQLNERLLVIFSGEKHHSGMSNWEVYKKAVEGDPEVIKGLKGIAEVAHKMDAVLRTEKVDWGTAGRYLDTEWDLRKTTFQVSTPTLDSIIQQTKEISGVLGVKVCGAAQGGSLVVLVDPGKKVSVVERLKKANLQVLPTQATLMGVSIQDAHLDMD
jgi:D-glycero-alpha-D-manno-heptose-7-phosphate kinase